MMKERGEGRKREDGKISGCDIKEIEKKDKKNRKIN